MVQFVAIPDNLLGEDKFYPLENLVGTYQGNLGNAIIGLVCYEGEQFSNRIQTTSQEGLPVYYNLVSGERLPVNLVLNPETGTLVSDGPLTLEHLPPDVDGKGNLTRDHEWTFVIEATDGSNTERQGFALKVKHINQAPVWITPNAPWSMFAANTINRTVVAYDPDFEDVPGANAAITYTLPAGLPAELANTVTFNNGTFSGSIPENLTANASYSFHVLATDLPPDYDPAFPNNPSAPISVERVFTLNVIYNNYPPVWVTNSLPGATRLIPYSVQLLATDPNPSDVLTFVVVSGSIPSGLTLSSTGLLAGTPDLTQTTNFTLRVSDPRGLFADHAFSLPVAQGNTPPVWQTPSTLGEAIGGASLAYALIAVDADPDATLTYTLVSGTLPPGLTMGSNGILTGLTQEVDNPTNYTFSVNVSDGIDTVLRTFTLTINPNPETPPIWDTPAGSLGGPFYGGDPFSFQLAAHDADSDPLTFTVEPTTPLPVGLSLSSSGLLSGSLPSTTVVSPTPTSLIPATQEQDNLVYDPFFQQGAGRWLNTGLWRSEGGPYIYLTKSDGYADNNLGSTVGTTDHFAVFGNAPYTFQYTALAYNIAAGTYGVNIEWFDINNGSLGYSDSIQDGNIGNPNVTPGTQVLRVKTVTSPVNAAWGRARCFSTNLVWISGSGGFGAIIQNLMVSNTNGVQSFNDNSTNGAPYRDPTYQYASSSTGGAFYFTVNLSDGDAVVPRSFSITVSPNAAPASLNWTSDASWTVPDGVTKVMFNWIIAGGGGGGASTEGGNGGGGGGGGSGGYYRYEEITCVPGDVFDFHIGAGGAGAPQADTGTAQNGNNGSGTSVLKNSTTIFTAMGGQGGTGNQDAIAPGGTGGTPNGTDGTYANRGPRDNSSVPGGAGASGPKLGSSGGAAGQAAAFAGCNGGAGQGYGSGGGGAGSHDRKVPRIRPGGDGVGGYVEITFPSQGPTGGTP
jgi:hypothetical protein